MAYRALKKGSGYVYEHQQQLYKRVKTLGVTKYLKCVVVGCDGSAKLVCDQFFLGVSVMLLQSINQYGRIALRLEFCIPVNLQR